jgi:electron transfer flavoprotein alpha subunit
MFAFTTLKTPKHFRSYSSQSSGSCLVVAEHDHKKLIGGTLNTLTAAKQLSSDITVLLAGNFKGDKSIAKQVAKLDGVKKVVVADHANFSHSLPET